MSMPWGSSRPAELVNILQSRNNRVPPLHPTILNTENNYDIAKVLCNRDKCQSNDL